MPRARTQDYGGYTSDVPMTYSATNTWSNRSDVNVTYGVKSVREARWQREGYTSNKVKAVQGVFPWRDPSSYFRLVINYAYEPAYQWWTRPYGTNGTQTTTYRGYYSIEAAHVTFLYTYPLGSGGNPQTLISEKARARTECLLKLNDAKVNIATALAESVQSLDMLADASRTLFQLLLDVKHGRFDRIPATFGLKKNTIKSVYSANWLLQVQYGWLPLMSDIHGLYEAFQDRAKVNPPIVSATRNINSVWDDSSTNSYWINRRQTIRCTNTCTIWAKLQNSYMRKAQQFGLLNPLSLAWELVPYSFVVDWAIPIGNTLEALSAKAGLDFMGGYEGERYEGTVTAQRSNPPGFQGNGVRCEADYFAYRRTKLLGFPVPQVYTKSPFSTSHASSALALLRQLF